MIRRTPTLTRVPYAPLLQSLLRGSRADEDSVGTAADVVIVGGGYTGLWTAFYLLEAEPTLDVVVLEAQHICFGASDRNGVWVSALWPFGPDTISRRHGR